MNKKRSYQYFLPYFSVIMCTLMYSGNEYSSSSFSSTKKVRHEQQPDHNRLLVEIDGESDLDFLDDLDQDLSIAEQTVSESIPHASSSYVNKPKGLLEYIYAGVVYIKNAFSRFFF